VDFYVILQKKLFSFFIIFLIIFSFTTLNFMWGANFWMVFGYSFMFYWLYSIFIFIAKHNKYAIYTNVAQRSWKRALALFWIVELFLFFIYMFMVVNHPVEIEWFLDQAQLFLNHYFNGVPFFKQLLTFLTLICVLTFSQYILTNFNKITMFLAFILLIFCYNFITREEYFQFYTITAYYNNPIWRLNLDKGYWDLLFELDKMRAHLHFIFLIVILKFWHILVIVGIFFGTVMFFIQSKQITQDSFSINRLNAYYLFFFVIVMQYVFYKYYMNFIYEYVYTWFFVNKFIAAQFTFINFLTCL